MENLGNGGVYNLWLLFAKARRYAFKAREKELIDERVTPEQSSFLHVLSHNKDGLTRSDISRLTCREVHTVSGIVSRMEKNGLVEMVSDTKRKNSLKVVITEDGEKIYQAALEKDALGRIFGVLNSEEQEVFKSMLMRIMEQSKEELGRYYKPPFLR